MIDLHLHLDGSLSKDDFIYLSKKEGIELGNDFPNNIRVPFDCTSLEEYLKSFELPLKLMQTKDSIYYVTKSLINRMYKEGYIYIEIRFAPLLHLNKGLTQDQVVETAIKAVEDALKDKKDFNANLILCMMRHASIELNRETMLVAKKYLGRHVVCVDLAGAEQLVPCTYFSSIYEEARKIKVPVIIHAGEATGNDEIMSAIDMGAKRIGHGVHLSLDTDSINKVKENDIAFEFCPTSNLQTKSLASYHQVPLMEFLKNGIKVTINSDNRTVSNTDVLKEFKAMYKTFNITKDDVLLLLRNSVNCAFISELEKNKFINIISKNIEYYYSMIIN